MTTFDNWYRRESQKGRFTGMKPSELLALYEKETTWIFGLRSAVDIKVFTYLLKLADKTGNVFIGPTTRKDLALLLGISMQQITNSLVSLKKEGLITGSNRNYKIDL